MLFWLVLHNLQLFGSEAAEAGFSGEKGTSSCLIRSTPNSMKFTVVNILENHWRSQKVDLRGPTRDPEGSLARPPLGRARRPPGTLVPHQGLPSGLYYPAGVKTQKEEELRSFAVALWRKPTEKKSHLRRADSAGEITSRKGRSSLSSSSRASSRSSSTSSPTSAPSPSTPHLISQLQLVL